jgi:hypothetical protein
LIYLSGIFKRRKRSPQKKLRMTINQEFLERIEVFKGFAEKQLA